MWAHLKVSAAGNREESLGPHPYKGMVFEPFFWSSEIWLSIFLLEQEPIIPAIKGIK